MIPKTILYLKNDKNEEQDTNHIAIMPPLIWKLHHNKSNS